MQFFKIKNENGISTIQMDRGTGNAINQVFVEELTQLFKEAENDKAIKGVLLTGKDHFFSVGLDLMELYEYKPHQYEDFWFAFMELIHTLATFSKPFITAITGHAPAGGCVMAICADYRVMAEGKYRIGLNEVPVGIIVPPSIVELYALWLGRKDATQALLEGKLFTVDEAKQIGLVDETVALEQVNEVAKQKLLAYTQLDESAWIATKKNTREYLLPFLTPQKDKYFKMAQVQWWKKEVRTALKNYIDKIKSKKS